MSRERIRNFIYLFVLLFLTWLGLTLSLNPQEIFAGVSVSLILALLLNKSFMNLGLPSLNITRIYFFIIYIFVLFKEIIKANLDVAYRVLHPKMPIKPGIVVIRTSLKTDIAKVALANSITLTPGTFTLDILGNELLIHWINVKDSGIEGASRIIAGKFEKYLKKVFE